MTTELSDKQYNELCKATMKMFGFENQLDASLIVNVTLCFRDWLAASYTVEGDDQTGGEGDFDAGVEGDFGAEGEAGFDGDFDAGGEAGFDGEVDFGAGDGDMVFEGDFGAEGEAGFDGDFDAGGEAGFDGEGDFGAEGEIDFGMGDGDDNFSFDDAPAPAPAPRQQARPAAPAPRQQTRPAAPAPATNSRQQARPAAPAPAANSRQQQARPAAPAPAPARAAAAPAAASAHAPAANGVNYDAMKMGDLVQLLKDRGLSEYAKLIKGDAATKSAEYKALLRKADKKIVTFSAKYSVDQLEQQAKKAGLDVKYGRGRATDERKKSMLLDALIANNTIKL